MIYVINIWKKNAESAVYTKSAAQKTNLHCNSFCKLEYEFYKLLKTKIKCLIKGEVCNFSSSTKWKIETVYRPVSWMSYLKLKRLVKTIFLCQVDWYTLKNRALFSVCCLTYPDNMTYATSYNFKNWPQVYHFKTCKRVLFVSAVLLYIEVHL